MSIFKVYADGEYAVLPWNRYGKEEELHMLQEHVGGLIEPVRIFSDPDLIALVNEDGRLLGLSENKRLPHLVGDVIFVRVEGEDLKPLKALQVAKLLGLMRKGGSI